MNIKQEHDRIVWSLELNRLERALASHLATTSEDYAKTIVPASYLRQLQNIAHGYPTHQDQLNQRIR